MRATIEGWRNELEAETREAKGQLSDALAAQVAAEADRDAAAELLQTWRNALVDLQAVPLAHALARRIALASPDMREAGREVMRAQGAVVAARERISDLTEALEQLALIHVPETAELETTDEAD